MLCHAPVGVQPKGVQSVEKFKNGAVPQVRGDLDSVLSRMNNGEEDDSPELYEEAARLNAEFIRLRQSLSDMRHLWVKLAAVMSVLDSTQTPELQDKLENIHTAFISVNKWGEEGKVMLSEITQLQHDYTRLQERIASERSRPAANAAAAAVAAHDQVLEIPNSVGKDT